MGSDRCLGCNKLVITLPHDDKTIDFYECKNCGKYWVEWAFKDENHVCYKNRREDFMEKLKQLLYDTREEIRILVAVKRASDPTTYRDVEYTIIIDIEEVNNYQRRD